MVDRFSRVQADLVLPVVAHAVMVSWTVLLLTLGVGCSSSDDSGSSAGGASSGGASSGGASSGGASSGGASSGGASSGGASSGGASSGGASACSASGPYDVLNQEPSCMVPYPNSLWAKPLPTDIMSHIVPTSLDWKTTGSFVQSVAHPNDWGAYPRYYANATDPMYKLDTASSGLSCQTFDGTFIRIPSAACFNQAADHALQLWDQTTNRTLGLYWFDATKDEFCLPPCDGMTEATACPLAWGGSACGVSDYASGPAYGDGVTVWGFGPDSLGNAPWSLHVRHKELMDGVILHPLLVGTNCTTGYVFPAHGATWECSASGLSDGPPTGALFFLDYTDEQIDAMALPAWQEPLVRAAARYGIYIGETSSEVVRTMKLRIEGPGAYEHAGTTSPVNAWLDAQGLQQDSQGRYSIPFLEIPDFKEHLHMADECVALGLAEKPGGCI